MNFLKKISSIPSKFYSWTAKLAESRHAERSLYSLSAAEAVFFPIPPDPLLMTLIFHKTKNWLRYSLLTAAASVVGGVAGYLIGWGLFESVGDAIINNLHIKDSFESLSESFRENGAIVVFSAALTPVPYKVITLTAGASGVNFGIFLIASIVGRFLRFIAVGALSHYLGKKHKEKIEKYINLISLLLVVLIVLVIVFLK